MHSITSYIFFRAPKTQALLVIILAPLEARKDIRYNHPILLGGPAHLFACSKMGLAKTFGFGKKLGVNLRFFVKFLSLKHVCF